MAQPSTKPPAAYFFGTCLVDSFYGDAGLAAIRLLEREGMEVIFPQKQSCCGQPAYNSGFPHEAKAVARKQISLFPKPYPIIVPSGSCAGMMRHHYPALFAGDPMEKKALDVAGRVYELGQFLLHQLNVTLTDLGSPLTVTWHSSCHAMREMKVTEDAKALIRQLENVTLVELSREYECCGFGGTFAVKQPHLSGAMVQDKIADIAQTGAERVITGDGGCLLNITGAMEKATMPVSGQHLAQFLWERTTR